MASTSSPGARRPLEQTDPQQPSAQSPSLLPRLGSDDANLDDDGDIEAQESTPLLRRPGTADSQPSIADCAKRPWWSIVAIIVLLVLTINIIVFAFVVPNTAENYASQATTYSLRNIQIQNITDTEVIIKAQVNITLDASRVNSSSVRRTGLFASNLFQHVYTQPCDVALRLPKYGGAEVGVLGLPALALDIRNRHINLLNITSNFTITDEGLAIQLASEYASGKSGEIRAIGDTNVSIRAGIIPLGTRHVEHEVVVVKGGSAPPTIPDFTITNFNVADSPKEGTVVTASANVANPFPLTFDVPSVLLSLIVPGCNLSDRIRVTDASIAPISIQPGRNISVDVRSAVSSLPAELSTPCGDDGPSPLEALMQSLVDPDQNVTVFVATSREMKSLPAWLARILSSITIPIPVPRVDTNTSDLVSSIHCSEMKVTFPSPWAPPDVPAGKPRISGVIEAVVVPPKAIDKVAVNVTALRTDVYLSDEGVKFGRIVVPVWIPAVTERRKKLHVTTRVAEVPVDVLDPIAFQRVMTKVLRGVETVTIGVDGTVDAQATVLIGKFTIRGIPVHGDVDVEGISPFGDLDMRLVGGVNVVSTTTDSITLTAAVEVKNPTEYEAVVPYLNLHLLYDGHLIGNVTTINANISKGLNRISGIITYAPATKQDIPYGEKFISEYISGNAYDCVRLIAGNAPNVTALFHNASIEGNPQLSSALAGINITLPVPGIRQSPTTFKSDESRDDSPFLRSATIHILTRTAQFELFNPLNNSGIIINSLVANATYDDVLVGSITEPLFNFPVLAGCEGYTMTEKVPVEVGSVGYDIIRRALGGQLVVDAVADVVATIGKWRGQIQYEGRGLGANVRL